MPFRTALDEGFDTPVLTDSFEACLRKQDDWTPEVATRLTLEYRRFLYFLSIANKPLFPLISVDRAGSLHKSFVDDYVTFCKAIIRRQPQALVVLNPAAQISTYGVTLALYRQEFGSLPSWDIWPSVAAVRRQRGLNALLLICLAGLSSSTGLTVYTGTNLWPGYILFGIPALIGLLIQHRGPEGVHRE